MFGKSATFSEHKKRFHLFYVSGLTQKHHNHEAFVFNNWTDDNMEDTLINETFDREEANRIFNDAIKDFWGVQIIMDENIILKSYSNSIFPK